MNPTLAEELWMGAGSSSQSFLSAGKLTAFQWIPQTQKYMDNTN